MSVPLWFHNLAAYWGQIALLAIVGTLLPALLRLRIPRVLLVYWQVLVGASLLLPALQPWKRLVTDSPTPLPAGLVWIEGAARAGHVTTGHFPFYSGVAVVLVTGIGVRLLWTAFGLLRLRRYRRKASPLPALPAAVEEIQSRFGIRPALCLSDEVSAPVTFGLMHPVILFPQRFTVMAPSFQRAIACHELLHVRRKDWAFVLIEEVNRACFWFHPAIWWLLGRIQLSREQVVDRQVVELTEARTPYLEALLVMAANSPASVAVPAPLFLSERQLTQRIALMLKEFSMSKPRLIASLLTAGWRRPFLSGLRRLKD